jgi:hypothetical protein
MPPLYEEVSIKDLVPGPKRVSFTGRVVNIYDQNVESKMPKAAKGCLKLLVKDASAMILVRLNIPRAVKTLARRNAPKLVGGRTLAISSSMPYNVLTLLRSNSGMLNPMNFA